MIASKVQDGISPNGRVIWTWHCMALTLAPLAILAIYGKYICIPYLQALQSCTAVSKTAATELKLGLCTEITYYLEIIPFPYKQMAVASNQGMS